MIPACKGCLRQRFVAAYVRRKVRASFRGLWLRGELPASSGGLLVYVNHTSWWDGFVLHQLAHAAGWDGYALMEERNLARYRFLRHLGAFSVRRGEASSSLETLRYARGLLRLPDAAVFVFPEGEHRPPGELPLRLERGVEALAKMSQVPSLPVAIRYAFFEHERPDVLFDVGTPHPPLRLGEYQRRLEERVVALQAVTRLDGFHKLLEGRRGVAERWDAVRGLGKREPR
ncbi:MAG TPA: lysophospholipid acyltransferase family protein [Myxococcaceae bacterium]|nr:lysophospholipid acyltransferase family protein [Myxococcaceae bacterium]